MEPTDHLGALTSVIASQAETIKSQAATIDALSGARGMVLDLDLTFGELWERYQQTFPATENWPRTARSLMIRPLEHFGAMCVVDLKPMHWSDFRDSKAVREKLAPSSRNQILARIKAMMNWAVADGRIHASPFKVVKPEKARPKRETEFSEFDEERILNAAPLRMSVFFMVAIDSGMRHSEIRLLRWDQVNVEAKTISLSWAETKGKRSGTAYLRDRSVAALKLLPRVEGSPYVFARPSDGQPYSYAAFYLTFRKLSEKLRLRAAPGDLRPRVHDCRHSLASRLSRNGAPLPAIQRILRHANVSTTERYIHTRPEDIAAAHALLDQCRSGPRKGPHRADDDTRREVPAPKKVSRAAKSL